MIYKMILAFVAMLMCAGVAVAEPPAKHKTKPTVVTVKHSFKAHGIRVEWTTKEVVKNKVVKHKHHKHHKHAKKDKQPNRMPPANMKWGPGMNHKGPPMGYPGMMSPENRMGPPTGPWNMKKRPPMDSH